MFIAVILLPWFKEPHCGFGVAMLTDVVSTSWFGRRGGEMALYRERSER